MNAVDPKRREAMRFLATQPANAYVEIPEHLRQGTLGLKSDGLAESTRRAGGYTLAGGLEYRLTEAGVKASKVALKGGK